jgi:signal transduction histidine kinase/pSer/pThr/pTyr-binding forkhead associated (FHA) protein
VKRLGLRALNGEIQDRTFEVADALVIGRADDCDLTIGDPRLSRRHARVSVEGAALFVEDLGSPNGTLVNDRRVQKAKLAAGDIVVLGKTRFAVISLDAGAPEDHHELGDDDPTAASAPAVDPSELLQGEPKTTTVIKTPRQSLAPSLGDISIDDYYTALGIGDETVLDMRADRLEALIRSTRSFAVLHEVSRAIQSERDPREMIGRVLSLIATVTKADRVYAGLTDETGAVKSGIVRTGLKGPRPFSRCGPEDGTPGSGLPMDAAAGDRSGSGDKPTAKDRVVISQTVAEHVLRGRSAVISSDPSTDARFQESASLLLSDTRSLMAVPILRGERLLGLIQVESSHLRERFTENDLDLVSVVAAMIGVALDNMRLADQLVRSEQLAAIGRFATGIAHEIKNQLSPFMLADVIAKRYPDDQKTRDAAEMMREAQQYILDLVNEIRAFASGRESTIEKAPHDLAALVERLVRFAECDTKIAKAQITVDAKARPVVELDPKGFRQVLINLIKNAADALPVRGGTIRIGIDATDASARIDVADNGKGIAPELGERVFEPFVTTKGESGLGLGLDISRKIVTDHGGTLTFVSAPGEGTTFTIELPLSRGPRSS